MDAQDAPEAAAAAERTCYLRDRDPGIRWGFFMSAAFGQCAGVGWVHAGFFVISVRGNAVLTDCWLQAVQIIRSSQVETAMRIKQTTKREGLK